MSDTDATRKRHRVADPLREYVGDAHGVIYIDADYARDLAYQIDRDHEHRMEQARKDSRKVTCNYVSRIVADYKRGKKWKRKDYE